MVGDKVIVTELVRDVDTVALILWDIVGVTLGQG